MAEPILTILLLSTFWPLSNYLCAMYYPIFTRLVLVHALFYTLLVLGMLVISTPVFIMANPAEISHHHALCQQQSPSRCSSGKLCSGDLARATNSRCRAIINNLRPYSSSRLRSSGMSRYANARTPASGQALLVPWQWHPRRRWAPRRRPSRTRLCRSYYHSTRVITHQGDTRESRLLLGERARVKRGPCLAPRAPASLQHL